MINIRSKVKAGPSLFLKQSLYSRIIFTSNSPVCRIDSSCKLFNFFGSPWYISYLDHGHGQGHGHRYGHDCGYLHGHGHDHSSSKNDGHDPSRNENDGQDPRRDKNDGHDHSRNKNDGMIIVVMKLWA